MGEMEKWRNGEVGEGEGEGSTWGGNKPQTARDPLATSDIASQATTLGN